MSSSTVASTPRVLHACSAYPPDCYGGIPTAVAALCAACPGSNRLVLTCGKGRETIEDNVRVRYVRSFGAVGSLPISPSWPVHFWREAARANLVAVHVPLPIAGLAAAMSIPDRVAVVVHWHSGGADRRHGSAGFRAPFTEALLRRADAIVVAGQNLARSPVLQAHRDKVAVVPFGVDADAWGAPPNGDEAWRAALLRMSYPRLVVALGCLAPYKGFEVLIEAMLELDAHLLIVGEGSHRASLERRIAGFGLAGRVTLCGAMSASQLRVVLRSADVFAFPSVLPRETFGIAQLEAMACGRPVVNTCLPTDVPWIARDGREALTVPPDRPHALAMAIKLLLDDPALARRLGEAGRVRARTQFSLAAFGQQIRRLYARAMTRRDAPLPQSISLNAPGES